jgi:probable rRNA maturation factor
MSEPVDPDREPTAAVVERGMLRVEGRDVAGRPPVELGRWCEVALYALEAEGVPLGQLDLHFVDTAEIAELNRSHLGGDGPTDVLSFPYEDDPWAVPGGPDAAPVVLGDVVICAEVAAGQAPGHAGSVDDELALLVVHGVLHVLGWDHAEPEEAIGMQDREAALLVGAGFDFTHPAHR